MDKVYNRTENGTLTTVSKRDGLNEINNAMIGPTRSSVRTMSSINRTDYAIEYKDGRKVRLVLVDAPAPVAAPVERTAMPAGHSTIAVKGKLYRVGPIVPANPRKPGMKSWTPVAYVQYWSERNGKQFGATRFASADNKRGSVGHAIWHAKLDAANGTAV